MNRGAYDFLTKPIDFADLEATIDKTLRELNELREGLVRARSLRVWNTSWTWPRKSSVRFCPRLSRTTRISRSAPPCGPPAR